MPKYRLVHMPGDPLKEMAALTSDHAKLDAANAPVMPLAVADGKKALEYMRAHAKELGVRPDKIGIMGFSAGGTVAAGVGYGYAAANRPDFLAPIYAYTAALPQQPVPADAPPLFVAAASDDPLGLAPQTVQLYSD